MFPNFCQDQNQLISTQMTPNQLANANQTNCMQQQPPTPNSQNQSQNTPQAVTPQLTPNQQNQMIPTPRPPSLPPQQVCYVLIISKFHLIIPISKFMYRKIFHLIFCFKLKLFISIILLEITIKCHFSPFLFP